MSEKKFRDYQKKTMGENYLKSKYKQEVIKRIYRRYYTKYPEETRNLINVIRKYKDAEFIHPLLLGGSVNKRNLQLIDSRTNFLLIKQIWEQVKN
ncbi:hypothetical protein EDM57_22410 [Brevibacillus gelatini]|uniref:Uncharacterized protein n=1 Tax=Brevibacillus gelatini TaxID=1655277 RepID=A0A3M8AJR6_9BACL|nr:hypothetical protein [Brevibacillus gelatini]RNB51438.1 hypothetical protein EDM57_22410 [Brevibacillus gelatini]